MRTALLIGNNDFPAADGKLQALRAPRNDLRRLADLLEREICGFEVKPPLLDSDARTIRGAVNRLMRDARPDDLVLLYYAGHGKVKGNQLYLCTHDTEVDLLESTSLPVRDIWEMVRTSSCDKVVLILDCCFSGAILDQLLARGDDDVSHIVEGAVGRRGWHVLASSDVHEPSYESGEGESAHGIYTNCLIEGIATGAADLNQDGTITPNELAEYAAARIRGQTPQVSHIGSTGSSPIIARNPWQLQDDARREINVLLTRWGLERRITAEVLQESMRLAKQEPLTPIERHRKKLLASLTKGAGWQAVFVDAWTALGSGDETDLAFERWLSERALDGKIPEDVYLPAMTLLKSEPANEFQAGRKRLLSLVRSMPEWDVPILLDAWHSTERRERQPAGGAGAPPGARRREGDPRAPDGTPPPDPPSPSGDGPAEDAGGSGTGPVGPPPRIRWPRIATVPPGWRRVALLAPVLVLTAAVVVDLARDGAPEPPPTTDPARVVEATPEPPVPLEAQIERALYRADTVVMGAKRTRDTTGLGTVVTGRAYELYADEIAGYRRNGLYQVHTLSGRRMEAPVRIDSTTVRVRTTETVGVVTYRVADDSCYKVFGPWPMSQTTVLELGPGGWRISNVIDQADFGPSACPGAS